MKSNKEKENYTIIIKHFEFYGGKIANAVEKARGHNLIRVQVRNLRWGKSPVTMRACQHDCSLCNVMQMKCFSIRNGTLKSALIKIIKIYGILNNNLKFISKT